MAEKENNVSRGFLFPLAEKGGKFSLSAFWFSVTMAVTLVLITALMVKLITDPGPHLVSGLSGAAAVLGVPNAILAGAYTWGKKVDGQN